MPRLPSKESIGGRVVPQVTRGIVGVEPSRMGRAVAGFGNTLAGVGAKMEEREDSLNYARARSYFLTEKTKLENELDDDQDFEGWDAKYESRLKQIQADAGKMITSNRDRVQFDAQNAPEIERGLGIVRDRQRGRLKEVALADLDTTVSKNMDALLMARDEETRKQIIATTNEAWDGLVKRGYVPASVAAQKKRAFVENYAEKRVDQMTPEEALRALGGAAPGSVSGAGYGAKVVKFESAGRNDAVNPDTNASGKHQFIDSTWLAQIARHAPELTQGKSRDQILALRSDANISQRVFDGFTRDNEVALAAAGVPVNDTTRYLAHWFGAGGAVQLMQADPSKPIEAFLPGGKSPTGKTWAEANGIQGKSVGDVIGIAQKRMGVDVRGGGGEKPQPTGTFVDFIPVGKRIDLQEKAATAWKQEQAAGRVEREARFTQDTTASLFGKFGYSASGQAKANAYIRANFEGKQQNDLLSAYKGRAEEMLRLERQGDDDLFQSTYELVWAGRANEITPDMRARLEQKGQWDKIGKEIEAQASGNPQATDWIWYHENYGSLSPADRSKVPLATLKEYMGKPDYDKIVKERKDLAADDPGQRSVSELITARVKALKLDPKKPADAADIDALHREIEDREAAYRRKNGQKMPASEQRKMVDELFAPIAIKRVGLFSSNIDAPFFRLTDPKSGEVEKIARDTGIPAEQVPSVIRTMRNNGVPINIPNIQKMWEDGTQ